MPRLLLVLACASLFLSACNQTAPGTGTYGSYSDAFYRWFYPTNGTAIDISNLRFGAEPQPETEPLMLQGLQQLAAQQSTTNRLLLDVRAPGEWQSFHSNIVAALQEFDAATADIRLVANTTDFAVLSMRLDEATVALLDRVVTCYAHAFSCREDASGLNR